MNEEIKCKATFLISAFKKLIIIGVIVCVLLFLGLKIDLIFRYFLSMLFVFIGIIIVFYQNRYDLESIKLQEGNIELTFFNKVFFKRTPFLFKKQEVSAQMLGGIIEIFKDKDTIAKVRNSSVSGEDWNKLKSYFAL